MSVASEIRAAVAFTGYPCGQNIYTGREPEYFVFNLQTIPADYADAEPQHERVIVQLHWFGKHTTNMTTAQKRIKRAIADAGFTYPALEDASDETAQHLVFEFQTAEGAA